MAKNNRLLIPVDFSPSDEKSIEFASAFAQKNNLLIDFIHVLSSSVDQVDLYESNNLNRKDELSPELRKETRFRMEKSMAENIPENLRGDCYLELAPYPSVAINTHASKSEYSMIIMSKNEKDPSGIFRNSTTEQVLQRSKVPVMILDEKTIFDDIKSILVPTDGSLLSMAAIPAALNLAELFNARITLLYVNEVYGLLSNHFSTKSYGNKKQEMIRYLFTRLREFFKTQSGYELETDEFFRNSRIRKSENYTIPLNLTIVTGLSAHHEITKYAKRLADFVVIATHGRSGIAQLFMGSNAEKVAQNIEKPLLTIRPDSDQFTSNRSEIKTSLQTPQSMKPSNT